MSVTVQKLTKCVLYKGLKVNKQTQKLNEVPSEPANPPPGLKDIITLKKSPEIHHLSPPEAVNTGMIV